MCCFGWVSVGRAGSGLAPQTALLEFHKKNQGGVWADNYSPASARITFRLDDAKSSLTETIYPQGF